jgi:hypothetical protein
MNGDTIGPNGSSSSTSQTGVKVGKYILGLFFLSFLYNIIMSLCSKQQPYSFSAADAIAFCERDL